MENATLIRSGPFSAFGRKTETACRLFARHGRNGAIKRLVRRRTSKRHAPRGFYVPDGLEPMDGNEEARQWFDIPKGFKDSWLGHHPDELKPAARKKIDEMYAAYEPAALKVVEFIRERMAFHGIGAENTYIFGVSQGAMLAVQLLGESDLLADERENGDLVPVGGAMIIAGCLLNAAEVEAHPSQSKPEFVLIHGSEDITVPYQGHLLTDKTLFLSGQKTETKVIWGKDHTFFEYQAMPDILRLASLWGERVPEDDNGEE